jgi:hypothetical protein
LLCRDEFSKVLGGGCEVEFVSGTARSSQSKSSQTEDAFEMGKQHLDLFSELAGDGVLRGL